MILVLTNNEDIYKLITKYEYQKDICYEKNCINISKYLAEDFSKRNTENITRVYIDVSSLENTNEEIITSILKLKIIYNLHIIVLALGYTAENELLSSLFENGIYNFVTSKDLTMQDEEMRKSITGNNYIDSIKYKSSNKTLKKTKKLQKVVKMEKCGKIFNKIKEKLKQFFRYIKNNAEKIIKIIIYIIIVLFAIIGCISMLNAETRRTFMNLFK